MDCAIALHSTRDQLSNFLGKSLIGETIGCTKKGNVGIHTSENNIKSVEVINTIRSVIVSRKIL